MEEWKLEEQRLIWEQSRLDVEYAAQLAYIHTRWEQLLSHKPQQPLLEDENG